MAQVTMTPVADKQFNRLPRTIMERVRKLTVRLQNWPDVSGAKALSGHLAGYYRMRTGDYRLRFKVEGENIVIDKIGHRKDFYEE